MFDAANPLPKAPEPDISYRICGGDMPYVEMTLAAGAKAIAEPGAMMAMDDGIEMNTVMGDGSASSWGFIGRFFRALKRPFSGESLFSVIFTNQSNEPLTVSFAAPFPGSIMAVDLAEAGGELICQRGAFLCGAVGAQIGVALQKRIRVGLFGGEGFIMQRISGAQLVFVNAGGTLTERVLGPGETIRVDTGCLAALQSTVSYDIKYSGKLKNAIFGGEGLFFAQVTGPGSVWLQSMPIGRLAGQILAYAKPQGRRGGFWTMLAIIGIIILNVLAESGQL